MGYESDDRPERARRALNTLHAAREAADEAVDGYIDVFYGVEDPTTSAEVQTARVELHKAVIRYYNRMRPYLRADDRLDDSITSDGERALRFGTLDNWRTPTTTALTTRERVGAADATEETTQQAALPATLALAAYDALNDAFVGMESGAELGRDVPVTDVDDDSEPAVEVVDGEETEAEA
jgi:hypothetical protein